jgi:hypothetical protein
MEADDLVARPERAELVGGRLVELGPARHGDCVVGRLMDQRVREAISLAECRRRRCDLEQPAADERSERRSRSTAEPRVEIASKHRSLLDRGALTGREAVEARKEQRAKGRRHGAVSFLRVREQLLDEERISLRSLDECVVAAEEPRELARLVGAERLKRDALSGRKEGRVLLDQLVAGEADDARAALRDVLDRRAHERRCPLNVVEHDRRAGVSDESEKRERNLVRGRPVERAGRVERARDLEQRPELLGAEGERPADEHVLGACELVHEPRLADARRADDERSARRAKACELVRPPDEWSFHTAHRLVRRFRPILSCAGADPCLLDDRSLDRSRRDQRVAARDADASG